MAKSYHIPVWKKAPSLRLLIPVILGILIQFYFKVPVFTLIFCGVILIAGVFLFTFLNEANRFHYKPVQGILLSAILIVLGSFLTWNKDIRNQHEWYGKYYNPESAIVVTILEPPVEKAKSYKALANVETVANSGSYVSTKGRVLLYFAKDTLAQKLKYGDRILLDKKLQQITNTGNPGGFDYAKYCAFHQIFHQAFVKQNEWKIVGRNNSTGKKIIFKTRAFILNALDQFIRGNDESSLAKALLIGYRVDLDKDLVQAYSNIGVVHLIAISGMHLALIYYFLFWISIRILFLKKSTASRLILILGCLWFFSFLTGAPASVLRSAVMFTFVAIGDSLSKKATIYNSLSVSALLLLCFDPYLLWDVGFQLSYLALMGIVIFQKYIANWFYFNNKISNKIWKLASVSLAAQVLTLPVCIYYFHQFPLLFLIANMVAIPVSSIALWGAIIVVIFSPVPSLALFFGKIVWAVIWFLNHFVLLINSIPFSLWGGISITVAGTFFLYGVIISFCYWLIQKNLIALKLAIAFTFIFVSITAYSKWQLIHQRRMIVYNIPMHKAVDFVRGNQYHFVGDSAVITDPLLHNFNIKPAHIAFQLDEAGSLGGFVFSDPHFFQFFDRKFLMIDSSSTVFLSPKKIQLDYILISQNAKIKVAELDANFTCKMYIFDASNSAWRIEKWKKECEELHLHFHSVSEKGAFVTNL